MYGSPRLQWRRSCTVLAEEGAVRIKQTVREQIGGSDSDARLVYLVGLFRRGVWLLWEEVLRERKGSAASVYILLLINLLVCAFPEAEVISFDFCTSVYRLDEWMNDCR